MAKINIIEDGNFTRWFRLCLVIVGFVGMYCTFKLMEPSIFSGILLLLGLGLSALGGFASRAALLRIKPFDNSYEKARKSYEVDNDVDGDEKP